MTTDAPKPETPDAAGATQPADPFEPEAPAHVDGDPETAAHDADADPDDATVAGADPTPPQAS